MIINTYMTFKMIYVNYKLVYDLSCLFFYIKFEFIMSGSFLLVRNQIEGGGRRGGSKEEKEEEREERGRKKKRKKGNR